MKKTIVFLALTLLLAATVFAQTEADFTVTQTSDGAGVVITGYTGKATQVIIPAAIQGMPVREIGERAFYLSKKLTSVTLPEGLIEIGNQAFYNIKLSSLTCL